MEDIIVERIGNFNRARRSGDRKNALYYLKLVRQMQRIRPQSVRRVAERLRATGVSPQMVQFAMEGRGSVAPSVAPSAAPRSVAAPRSAAPSSSVAPSSPAARSVAAPRSVAENIASMHRMRIDRARNALVSGNAQRRPFENVRRNTASWLVPVADDIDAARSLKNVNTADKVVDTLGRLKTLPEGYRDDVARVLKTYKNAGFHVAQTNRGENMRMHARMALVKSKMNRKNFYEAIHEMAPLSGGNATNADPDIRTLENATRAIEYLQTDGVASDPKTAAYVRSLMKFVVSLY